MILSSGRDISFYVFTLPFLRYVQGWLLAVLLLVGAGVLLIYLYQQGINSASGRNSIAPHVRGHLSVLGALALFVVSWSYYLDRFDLLYGNGLVSGAGYTDIHVRLPMLNLLIGVTVLCGLAVLINAWRRTIALPVVAFGLFLAFAGAGVIIPGAVQRLSVKPNEGEYEAPYLTRSIAATRAAYDVEDVKTENFPADTTLTAATLTRNQATIDNIRIWGLRAAAGDVPAAAGDAAVLCVSRCRCRPLPFERWARPSGALCGP